MRSPRAFVFAPAAIAQDLTGNWRADHLFNLRQDLKMYDLIEERLAEFQRQRRQRCDLCHHLQTRNADLPSALRLRRMQAVAGQFGY